MNYKLFGLTIIFWVATPFILSAQGSDAPITDSVTIIDSMHYSHIFADSRKYRIFLPPDYQVDGSKRYSVINFFHGWAQRYFGEMAEGYSDYEKGDDNGGDSK